MNPLKSIIAILAILLVSTIGYSQGFIAAVSEFQPADDCKMELLDGSIVEGKVSMAVIISGKLSSVTLKDAAGEKHKHKTATIKRLYVKMGFLAKMDAASEASSSVSEMFKTDFNEIINRDYIIYEQALIPKKKDKYRLLQLVNPGFDRAIKVYDDPTGDETNGVGLGGVQLTGGKEKSYLVVVNGAKSIKVKKGKYKKLFPEIFGDCPELVEIMRDSKIKFWEMSSHVFAYDQLCGGK